METMMNLKNTLQLEKHIAKENTNTCEEHNIMLMKTQGAWKE